MIKKDDVEQLLSLRADGNLYHRESQTLRKRLTLLVWLSTFEIFQLSLIIKEAGLFLA